MDPYPNHLTLIRHEVWWTEFGFNINETRD